MEVSDKQNHTTEGYDELGHDMSQIGTIHERKKSNSGK
jgi:hypothetical protein